MSIDAISELRALVAAPESYSLADTVSAVRADLVHARRERQRARSALKEEQRQHAETKAQRDTACRMLAGHRGVLRELSTLNGDKATELGFLIRERIEEMRDELVEHQDVMTRLADLAPGSPTSLDEIESAIKSVIDHHATMKAEWTGMAAANTAKSAALEQSAKVSAERLDALVRIERLLHASDTRSWDELIQRIEAMVLVSGMSPAEFARHCQLAEEWRRASAQTEVPS